MPDEEDEVEKETLADKVTNATTTGIASFKPAEDLGEAVENKVVEGIFGDNED